MRGGRDHDEYDYDYQQQQDDDSWSPDEYFSPEGIKGRWASDRDVQRSQGGGHGRDDRYDDGDGYGANGYYGGDGYDPDGRYEGDGYGADGYGDSAYGQDGYSPGGYGAYADEDYGAAGAPGVAGDAGGAGEAASRGGRRRRADKGERGGLRRLVRRREEDADIWPDDGVSDEDYWASVAADKPLPAAEPDAATQLMPARPAAGAGAPGGKGPGALGPAPLSASAADPDADDAAPPQRQSARPGFREPLGAPSGGGYGGGASDSDSFDSVPGGFDSVPGGFDRASGAAPGRGSGGRPDAPARPAAGIAQPRVSPSTDPVAAR